MCGILCLSLAAIGIVSAIQDSVQANAGVLDHSFSEILLNKTLQVDDPENRQLAFPKELRKTSYLFIEQNKDANGFYTERRKDRTDADSQSFHLSRRNITEPNGFQREETEILF